MKTRDEKIIEINKNMGNNIYSELYGDYKGETYIGNILDYIDKNCFRLGENEYGLTEIDVKEREKNVIWLYNHFIGRHNRSIDEQADECIAFVFGLLK